jgi:hypothetical protein
LSILIGERDVWSSKLMTSEIMKEHEMLFETMNPLRRFLKYGNVVLEEGRWIPVDAFLTEFNTFCTRHGARKIAWNESLYDSVFREVKLEVKNAKFEYEEEGVLKSGAVIVGCTFNGCEDKARKIAGEENPQYID